MRLSTRVRLACAALAVSAAFVLAAPASAQDVSETHMKAARAAVDAINATDSYDIILPQAALSLKQQLIQQNPDIEALIVATVDERAIAMAGRRADLEREAALAYARVFEEPELNEIAAFYNTETGKKLLSQGPTVSRELIKAADIWKRGIARDLAEEVTTKLNQVIGASTPGATVQAPPPEPEGETAAQ